MNLQKLSLLVILCFFCLPVFSQEADNLQPEFETEDIIDSFEIDAELPEEEPVFIINSIDFNIDGITRPSALIYKGELKAGEEIIGLDNLEKYIQDKTQILYNERVLESVSIDYETGEEEEGGKIPVYLTVNIKDTWNIIALPRPRFRSGYGFDLTLKARDYNFLGTMSPLRLDIWYKRDEDGHNFFGAELDSNTPFWALGLKWNFKFLNSFDYRPDMEQKFYYKNTTGLSVEFPIKSTTLSVGFYESFILNEENSDMDKIVYGIGDFQDGFYMSSEPFISWKIPTGIEIGGYGDLIYTPEISAVFNHEFSQWPLDVIRKGPFLIFGQSFGFDRIDWIDNFQKGFDVHIDNSFKYDFYRANNNQKPLVSFLGFSGIGHFMITDFFGISTRLRYRHWFLREGEYEEAGDALRGILDKDLLVDYMLSLNLDFPVRVLRFLPSVWLDNKKLRIFNLDFHLSPIFDAALYHDPVNKTEFNLKNILVTGGIEAIIFPEFFRSLYLRVSCGWNLRDFAHGKNNEIYIGTEFHY